MAKEQKTNVMRILEKNKIDYQAYFYECDEFIDGLHTAQKTGAPVEQSFKTLVAQGKSGQFYVFVIPIADEVNLKEAAKSVGEKSVELIHVKDINAVTGYIRGGCSPVGMKKNYKTVIHKTAAEYEDIYISGGKTGCTVKLNPGELIKLIAGSYADITEK